MINTDYEVEPIETITNAREHLNEFIDKIKIEEKKYPITERENKCYKRCLQYSRQSDKIYVKRRMLCLT